MKKAQMVKEYILENIANKKYLAGHRIESEPVLSERLKVSRMTVREAIRDLVEEKVLQKQQGRGTFVLKQPKFKGFQCGIGFSEEMRRHGMTPSVSDVKLCEIMANEEIAQDLEIPLHSKVWKINRICLADGLPVAYEDEYFSKLIVPNLTSDIVSHSIYQYLASIGIEFAYVDQMFDAILADETVAEKLNVPVGFPLIRMMIVAYLKNGTPFNCGITYYRTDSFKLSQTVFRK